MKTILAYGDSNTWGARPMASASDLGRYSPESRWPGVAEARLGTGYRVIEEGLNGRTTCHEDPIEGRYKNGEAFLPVALESHAPLDLVVIMLGTNDLKARFSLTAGDIAAGAGRLASQVLASRFYGGAPKVLLVAPAPLTTLGWLGDMFAGGTEKSTHFAREYKAVADRLGTAFLDAGSIIKSSEGDGIHLDPDAQIALGEAIAFRIRQILG